MATSKLHVEQGGQVPDDDFTRPVMSLDEVGRWSPVHRRAAPLRAARKRKSLLAVVGTMAVGLGVGSWFLTVRQRRPAPAARRRKLRWFDVPLRFALARASSMSKPAEKVLQSPLAPVGALRRPYLPPRAVGLLSGLLPQVVSLICMVVLGVYKARSQGWLETGSDAPQPLCFQGATTKELRAVTPSYAAAAHTPSKAHPAPQNSSWWVLLKAVFAGWSADKAPRLGAALAYYAVFSLAPLLVISLAVASFFFGAEAAQSQLHSQLQGFLGDQGPQQSNRS